MAIYFICEKCNKTYKYSMMSIEPDICDGCYRNEINEREKQERFLTDQAEKRQAELQQHRDELIDQMMKVEIGMAFIEVDGEIVHIDNIISIIPRVMNKYDSDFNPIPDFYYLEIKTRDGRDFPIRPAYTTIEKRDEAYTTR